MTDTSHAAQHEPPTRRPLERLTPLFTGLSEDLWLYLRYILLSKTLALLILFPLYRLTLHVLLEASGRHTFTSGDARGFLLSAPGLVAILVSLLLATILFLLDGVAYVIAAQARIAGQPLPTARALLRAALSTFPRLLHPSSLLLIPYLLVIAPLVQIGPRIDTLDWLTVPAFITGAINASLLYSLLYGIALLAISILGILLVATIPALLTKKLTPGRAMLTSIRFVASDWKGLLRDSLIVSTPFILGALLLALLAAGSTILLATFFPASAAFERFTLLVLGGVFTGLPLLLLLIEVPLQLRVVTWRFSRQQAPDTAPTAMSNPSPRSRHALKRLLALALSVLVLFLASCALLASEPVAAELTGTKDTTTMHVVAHRGGGDLDAENSLAGIEEAIKEGVAWTEIDVQRTSDNHYVINHDATFSRVAGHSAASQDMTLNEIRSLQLTNAFTPGAPTRPVATLEEILDLAHNRIGVFIELKGSTADQRMVNDVADMVRVRGMEKQVVLLTLDFDLLRTINTTHPELATGYLYFFAFGAPADIPSNTLVMEEGVYSEELAEEAHAAGKKVFVWTVNSEESMRRFSASSVDGVITDHPVQMTKVIAKRSLSSELERLADAIFFE